MLRISKGKVTLTLKGDHLETKFQGFYQKKAPFNGDFSFHPCTLIIHFVKNKD